MQITILKVTDRNRIWQLLNQDQKEIFQKYFRIQMADSLLNRTFHGATRWRLFAINIDYDWDARKKGVLCSPALRCQCGRRLRYQYELESIGHDQKHIKLGSTHFSEHLGIPLSIATEVKNQVNQIQSVMDEILVKFDHNERFPKRFSAKIIDGMLCLATEKFANRILDFQRVDMPLFSCDVAELHRMTMKYTAQEIASAKSAYITSQRHLIGPKKIHEEANSKSKPVYYPNYDYVQKRKSTRYSHQLRKSVDLTKCQPFLDAEYQFIKYLKAPNSKLSTPGIRQKFDEIDEMLKSMLKLLNKSPRGNDYAIKLKREANECRKLINQLPRTKTAVPVKQKSSRTINKPRVALYEYKVSAAIKPAFTSNDPELQHHHEIFEHQRKKYVRILENNVRKTPMPDFLRTCAAINSELSIIGNLLNESSTEIGDLDKRLTRFTALIAQLTSNNQR